MLENGIQLSIYGIGVTFAALLGLIGVIGVLNWLFRARENSDLNIESEDREDERVVAVLAASWYLSQKRSGSLGESLEVPRGKWWNRPAVRKPIRKIGSNNEEN